MYEAPRDLSPALQSRIARDRAEHWTNPFRCDDSTALRRVDTTRDRANLWRPAFVRDVEKIMNVPAYNRLAGKTQVFSFRSTALRRVDTTRDRANLWRPAFVRDVEKIMNVPAYNRLAGKTQVFSFRQNDDIARRGLHVQLVSRVARDIGAALGLNLDLIEAISLGHDIGHTPFGHAGERCLAEKYHRRTGRWFRHNVHSVEVLDRIYGRNVSLQVLDGILCHNGYFAAPSMPVGNRNTFEALDDTVAACCEKGDEVIRTLAPMTLEAAVVRVSDMIAYVGRDRQDAESAGLIDPSAHFETGASGAYNSWVLQVLTVDIVENSYGKDHIEMSGRAFDELVAAKRENYSMIYRNPEVEGDWVLTVDIVENSYGKDHIEMSGRAFDELVAAKRENYSMIYRNPEVEGDCVAAIRPRFDRLYDRLLEDLASGDETRPIYERHIKPVARHAGYYGHVYDWESDRDRTVVDFIASMTDDFFMALCDRLFPDEQGSVPLRSYYGHVYDWESDRDRTVVDFIASMTDDFFMALCDRLFPDEQGSVPLRSYFD